MTVPACLEATLALGDGSKGAPLSKVLQLTSREVANLYVASPEQFHFSFQATNSKLASS